MTEAHVIHIDELLNSLARENHRQQDEIYIRDTGLPLIHKIQRRSINEDVDAYKPKIISIGPYHHESPSTQDMEEMKWSCLDCVLKLNHEKNIQDYLQAIKGMEKDARSYYASGIEMDSNSFARMLLLDGCFVLLALHGIDTVLPTMSSIDMPAASEATGPKNNDKLVLVDDGGMQVEIGQESSQADTNKAPQIDLEDSAKQCQTYFIARDLLLFENQIPFFVIEEIYEIFTNGREKLPFLTQSVTQSMEDMINCYQRSVQECDRPKHFHHLLQLCHMYFKPSQIEMDDGHQNHVRVRKKNEQISAESYGDLESSMALKSPSCWRSATEFHEAGVTFKKKESCSDNPHSLLDVEFRNGIMEIPCLVIHPNTSSLFQNLVAFEQACPQFGNYITAYIVFWSHFVSKPEDVALLTARGIIVHQLSSDAEICSLFRSLGKDANFDLNCDNYLKPLSNTMEVHYQNQRPTLKEFFGSITAHVYGRARQKNSYKLPVRMPPV